MMPSNDEQITIELKGEFKDLGEDGTFSGIASVYGIEDLTGDVIDKGAFTKTLSESASVPILWQHQPTEPIGNGEVKEWQGKILVNGKFDMDDPVAVKAHRKLKSKIIKGLSIGFKTIKSTWEEIEGRLVRHITELKLYEVSVVTFAALPQAQVTRVKSQDDIEMRFKSIEEQIQALSAAKATPPEEPAKVDEPPPQQGIEPVQDHSALSPLLTQLTEEFRWNRLNNS